jgi:hypothetical protein
MATLKRQKARKGYECSKCKALIKKGEHYFRFKLTRFSSVQMRCSLHRPTRQEMTTSDFWSQVYDLEDSISNLSAEEMESARDAIDPILSDIETLRDEQEEKLYNMPDQLQDSDTGQLLQERYDGMQEWYDELDGVDTDIDEGLAEDYEEGDEKDLTEDELEARKEEREEKREARLEEILDELQATSYSGS